MLKYLRYIESFIVTTLIIILIIVIFFSILDLGRLIIVDLLSPPLMFLEVGELIDIFSFFLAILIGVELLETLKAYARDHKLHAEIVLLTAVIAIARKVITTNVYKLDGLSLIGMGFIIISLAGAYYFFTRKVSLKDGAGESREAPEE